MDYKKILNIKEQRNFLLISSVLIFFILLAFPVLEWKEFSAELTHVIGSAPGKRYYLFSSEVNNSFFVFISSILLLLVSVINYKKTQEGEKMSSEMKIVYGVISLLFLIALSTMPGDPDYSVLTTTSTVAFTALLTIIGIVWVILYPIYLRYKSK